MTIKSRLVKVVGPRGELTKSIRHVDCETQFVTPQKLKITLWLATRKHSACLRTVASHIQNMIKGVTSVGS